jgi:IS30 family transposase
MPTATQCSDLESVGRVAAMAPVKTDGGHEPGTPGISYNSHSEWLRNRDPLNETMRISHEAIYQSLYVQGRGALRRELTACLRTGRALRVPEKRTQGRGKNFISPEVMVTQRPAEAKDRAVPGHWEGDLVRHEALFDRAVMKGHRRRDVAAARLKLRAA